MPDECMASQYLPVSCREACDDISLSVTVGVLCGFRIYEYVSQLLYSVLETNLSQGRTQNFKWMTE